MNAVSLLLLLVISCGNAPVTPVKNYKPVHYEALQFCKDNNMCQEYYFLIDLSVHSGRNRFFVYDFKKVTVTHKNLVTHGSCDAFSDNATKYEKVKFDNRDDSHCSSLGKYKIGKRDYSSWGIKVKYWLDGLEVTNTHARSRIVVLHSWDAVADAEIYPRYTPLSWGCPAVSNNFMTLLDAKLKFTDKPVLLWIIE